MKSAHIPITEAVDLYTASSENDERKHYLNILTHAKWAWKKLFWTTLYVLKSKVVAVTRVSPRLAFIDYPTDMEQFYNICVEDACNGLRALMMDDSINTLPLPAIPNINTCDSCGGTNELATCINEFTLVTREIVIDGVTWLEKTWKKVTADGSVYEIRESPVETPGVNGQFTVKMVTTERCISQLAVSSCGCITRSPENLHKIVNECGCAGITPMVHGMVQHLTRPYQKFGAVKLEGGKIWIHGNVPPFVLLCYKTNGECRGEEIMVPEMAVDALQYGIDHMAKRFSPRIGRLEKQAVKNLWDEAQDQLLLDLNPIRAEDFLNSQMAIPLWGNAGIGVDDDCCLPLPMPLPMVPVPALAATQVTSIQNSSNGMEAINQDIEVIDNTSAIKPGDTTYFLARNFIIQHSVLVQLDGAGLPERGSPEALQATERVACMIVYDADGAHITFNAPAIARQNYKITGFSFIP